MDVATLQRRLVALGLDPGPVDGQFGPRSRAATLRALTDGPDWKLEQSDVELVARDLGVDPAAIWAVYDVEAAGDAFIDGRPAILFEPHRFSKATKGRFDRTHPRISSPSWNRKLYPGSQIGRWTQVLDAVALNVDAGFASASYGGFQILGENYAVCGAPSPWAFAWRQAQTEGDQIEAFSLFVRGRGLAGALRRLDWPAFARGYNGTAYRLNKYDTKLAAAYARRKVTGLASA